MYSMFMFNCCRVSHVSPPAESPLTAQDLFKPALDVDLSLVLPGVVQHLICGKGGTALGEEW